MTMASTDPVAALAGALAPSLPDDFAGIEHLVAEETLERLRAAGFDVARAPTGGLTIRQTECLAAIQQAIDATGAAPSFAELRRALGLASNSGVHRLVHGLAARGWIGITANRSRTITLQRRLALPTEHPGGGI